MFNGIEAWFVPSRASRLVPGHIINSKHFCNTLPSSAMATESKTSPDTMYPVGARVLCYHGAHIYEAKVLQNQWFPEPAPLTNIPGAHYFVHYKGWKQT